MRAYPDVPGFKTGSPDTSAAAAEAMAGKVVVIRNRVLDVLQAAPGGLTADQVAARLHLSVLTVRPRVSELRRMGKIIQTGERRRNASGNTAAVWIVRSDA